LQNVDSHKRLSLVLLEYDIPLMAATLSMHADSYCIAPFRGSAGRFGAFVTAVALIAA
jgi:hypothetical protein